MVQMRTAAAAIGLAAAILDCGCANLPPGTVDLYVDTSAGAEVLLDTVAAASDWMANTDAVVRVHDGLGTCRGDACYNVSTLPYEALDAMTGHAGDIGHTFVEDSSKIVIDDALTGVKLRVTITHEIGHTLGLRHVTALAIMNPEWSGAAHQVTCDDVNQYDQVHGMKGLSCE